MARVGIAGAGLHLPPRTETVPAILEREGKAISPAVLSALGIDRVHACAGETGSAMALAASEQALREAGVAPTEIDAIIDYSVLPQEYLVPSWSMSNKLQADLGAKNAFTLGFSGGGATQFLLALKTAASLIDTDDGLHTVLVVGAEVALPGSRVLGSDPPVTVLGDGAGALVLRRDAERGRVADVELWSDGSLHDVCYVPGGALAHPDRLDLYRLLLDERRYGSETRLQMLAQVAGRLLDRAGLAGGDVAALLPPDLSSADRAACAGALGMADRTADRAGRQSHGCLLGTDWVAAWMAIRRDGSRRAGERLLLASHGMGFLHGACLVEY